jgi:hypothetical protein
MRNPYSIRVGRHKGESENPGDERRKSIKNSIPAVQGLGFADCTMSTHGLLGSQLAVSTPGSRTVVPTMRLRAATVVPCFSTTRYDAGTWECGVPAEQV